MRQRLLDDGYQQAVLWVYVHNVRATALYQRPGWRPSGDPAPHPPTGKPEQRYELGL